MSIVHGHNRPVNVYEYDHKAGSKHANVVDAAAAYTIPEAGQVVMVSINQVVEMKVLNNYLLCSIQCHINGVLIDEVPKFLASIPNENTHVIQIENCLITSNPL